MNRRLGFRRVGVGLGLVLGLAVPACTSANDAVSQDGSDLATETSYVACTKAAPTSDGQSLVYATCPSGYNGGSIVLQAVGGGRRTLKSYTTNDTILATGAAGTTVWWAYRTPGLPPQIRMLNTVGTPTLVEANLPIEPQAISAVRALADGTLAMVATGKDWKRYLITGRANTTPLVAETIGEGAYDSFDLWASSGGYELYLVERINAGGVGYWRRIDHQGTGAPTVGAPVHSEKQVGAVAKGEFLGALFFAEVNTAPGVFGIGVVTMSTGKVQVLADGFTSFSSFVTSRNIAWFAGEKTANTWELDRVSTRPDVYPPQTLLTESGVLWAYLSADATTFVFRGGPQRGANTLGTVAADGTTRPSYVINASEGKAIDFVNPQPEAGRYLISLVDAHLVGARETMRLIDGTTAQKLGEWTDGLDYETSWATQLSGNGQAVFGYRKCNATTTSYGTQWMELWPAYTPVSGCEQGSDTLTSRDLQPIPNSSAVMIGGSGDGAGVVRVFRP